MSAQVTERQLLTVHEAAGRLRLTERQVRRKIAGGEIRAVQLGGPGCALRIFEEDLQRFIFGAPLERRGPESSAVEPRQHGGEAA